MNATTNSKFKKALHKMPKDLLDKMRVAADKIQLDKESFKEYLETQRLPKNNI